MNTQEIAAQLWDEFPLLHFNAFRTEITVSPRVDLKYPPTIKLSPFRSGWTADVTVNLPGFRQGVNCGGATPEDALKIVLRLCAEGVAHYDVKAAADIQRLARGQVNQTGETK